MQEEPWYNPIVVFLTGMSVPLGSSERMYQEVQVPHEEAVRGLEAFQNEIVAVATGTSSGASGAWPEEYVRAMATFASGDGADYVQGLKDTAGQLADGAHEFGYQIDYTNAMIVGQVVVFLAEWALTLVLAYFNPVQALVEQLALERVFGQFFKLALVRFAISAGLIMSVSVGLAAALDGLTRWVLAQHGETTTQGSQYRKQSLEFGAIQGAFGAFLPFVMEPAAKLFSKFFGPAVSKSIRETVDAAADPGKVLARDLGGDLEKVLGRDLGGDLGKDAGGGAGKNLSKGVVREADEEVAPPPRVVFSRRFADEVAGMAGALHTGVVDVQARRAFTRGMGELFAQAFGEVGRVAGEGWALAFARDLGRPGLERSLRGALEELPAQVAGERLRRALSRGVVRALDAQWVEKAANRLLVEAPINALHQNVSEGVFNWKTTGKFTTSFATGISGAGGGMISGVLHAHALHAANTLKTGSLGTPPPLDINPSQFNSDKLAANTGGVGGKAGAGGFWPFAGSRGESPYNAEQWSESTETLVDPEAGPHTGSPSLVAGSRERTPTPASELPARPVASGGFGVGVGAASRAARWVGDAAGWKGTSGQAEPGQPLPPAGPGHHLADALVRDRDRYWADPAFERALLNAYATAHGMNTAQADLFTALSYRSPSLDREPITAWLEGLLRAPGTGHQHPAVAGLAATIAAGTFQAGADHLPHDTGTDTDTEEGFHDARSDFDTATLVQSAHTDESGTLSGETPAGEDENATGKDTDHTVAKDTAPPTKPTPARPTEEIKNWLTGVAAAQKDTLYGAGDRTQGTEQSIVNSVLIADRAPDENGGTDGEADAHSGMGDDGESISGDTLVDVQDGKGDKGAPGKQEYIDRWLHRLVNPDGQADIPLAWAFGKTALAGAPAHDVTVRMLNRVQTDRPSVRGGFNPAQYIHSDDQGLIVWGAPGRPVWRNTGEHEDPQTVFTNGFRARNLRNIVDIVTWVTSYPNGGAQFVSTTRNQRLPKYSNVRNYRYQYKILSNFPGVNVGATVDKLVVNDPTLEDDIPQLLTYRDDEEEVAFVADIQAEAVVSVFDRLTQRTGKWNQSTQTVEWTGGDVQVFMADSGPAIHGKMHVVLQEAVDAARNDSNASRERLDRLQAALDTHVRSAGGPVLAAGSGTQAVPAELHTVNSHPGARSAGDEPPASWTRFAQPDPNRSQSWFDYEVSDAGDIRFQDGYGREVVVPRGGWAAYGQDFLHVEEGMLLRGDTGWIARVANWDTLDDVLPTPAPLYSPHTDGRTLRMAPHTGTQTAESATASKGKEPVRDVATRARGLDRTVSTEAAAAPRTVSVTLTQKPAARPSDDVFSMLVPESRLEPDSEGEGRPRPGDGSGEGDPSAVRERVEEGDVSAIREQVDAAVEEAYRSLREEGHGSGDLDAALGARLGLEHEAQADLALCLTVQGVLQARWRPGLLRATDGGGMPVISRSRDDAELPGGAGLGALAPQHSWSRVGYFSEVTAALSPGEMGLIAWQRQGEPGHVVAVYHHPDAGLLWIDPTKGPNDRVSPDAPRWDAVRARAVVLTPGGVARPDALTSTVESGSQAQTLIDAPADSRYGVDQDALDQADRGRYRESSPDEVLWRFSPLEPEMVFPHNRGFRVPNESRRVQIKDYRALDYTAQFISTTRDRDFRYNGRRYRYEIRPGRNSDPAAQTGLAVGGPESEVIFTNPIEPDAVVSVYDYEKRRTGVWNHETGTIEWSDGDRQTDAPVPGASQPSSHRPSFSGTGQQNPSGRPAAGYGGPHSSVIPSALRAPQGPPLSPYQSAYKKPAFTPTGAHGGSSVIDPRLHAAHNSRAATSQRLFPASLQRPGQPTPQTPASGSGTRFPGLYTGENLRQGAPGQIAPSAYRQPSASASSQRPPRQSSYGGPPLATASGSGGGQAGFPTHSPYQAPDPLASAHHHGYAGPPQQAAPFSPHQQAPFQQPVLPQGPRQQFPPHGPFQHAPAQQSPFPDPAQPQVPPTSSHEPAVIPHFSDMPDVNTQHKKPKKGF